ncbi:hypothetical protein HQ529_03090 [Candidatus Woesearchaeota archaeon]|nr:hypothetical protein [Candidatus Woesearchaeota archaeon]
MYATKKVEGGKLINIEVSDGDVKITGDFFLHPEESISEIEKILEENIDNHYLIIEQIDDFISSNDIQLIGVSSSDIFDVFKEALK